MARRDLAEVIGRGLQVPLVSLPADKAAGRFGWLVMLSGHDLSASSVWTRQQRGWQPNGLGLLADLAGHFDG